jgi:hypothetical protein
MPRFAHFDSSITGAPAPVISWLDTDLLNYPVIPPDEDLLVMTDAQWSSRMKRRWAVQGGQLVEYHPPVPPAFIVAAKIAQGLTLQPSGAVLSLLPGDIEDIRLAALDVAAGFGLPLGAETFDAITTTGTIALTETQVVTVYRAARNLLAGLGHQVAIMERGDEPRWVEQTITLEPGGA